MVCEDILDLVEPIAAGDVRLDDDARAHIESCPTCAGALASARALEAALLAVAVPPTPAAFTAAVLQHIRRERWRSEQHVDRLFNLAIAAAVMLVAGGIAAMLNVDAVFSLTASAWILIKEGTGNAVRQAVPVAFTYIAAAGLLISALVMWWWAERRLQF
jgi:anti-sigma factor RsiW